MWTEVWGLRREGTPRRHTSRTSIPQWLLALPKMIELSWRVWLWARAFTAHQIGLHWRVSDGWSVLGPDFGTARSEWLFVLRSSSLHPSRPYQSSRISHFNKRFFFDYTQNSQKCLKCAIWSVWHEKKDVADFARCRPLDWVHAKLTVSHTIHITACFAVENAVADGENAVAVGEARGSKCSLLYM